ncbi:uncharacterized protein LOC116344847 [Contarinia nasturtii]|uniref:uncharacterized protein LOC116344847 n=1 Tax=Contarinia nasturtii TaxID=265458 RepID=UPI0012D41174|nr:uncharacterized protein LOC116344847 [Contarinia nasturtii]
MQFSHYILVVLTLCEGFLASSASGVTLNLYKNKDVLATRTIPDLTALNSKLGNSDQKNDYFIKLLQAWDNLNFDRTFISRDLEFTVVVPSVDISKINRDRLKEFIFEHLIPGEAFTTFNEEDLYGNSNNHLIKFTHLNKFNESIWALNDLKILRTAVLNKQCSVIYIDGVLGDKRTLFSKRNIHDNNRYNEPQKLEWKNATKEEVLPSKYELKQNALVTFLMNMKTGTKVFQHFLMKSNLSHLVDEKAYTIMIPVDSAFQRWHPIDWGFYPFSVSEFTENILRNHFLQLKAPIRMQDIKKATEISKVKTMGGETVTFRNSPLPTVNNVTITADYTLPDGSQVLLISEVLFVSEAVVSRLHQMHKDKETPPLLAFPWFGAQFLSHSFLALERDPRFTFVTKLLNNAEIAPYVPGANYTFFVPMDDAFHKHELNELSEEDMSSETAIKFLLNHFIKGRLYDRNLKHDEVFESIGGTGLKIQRIAPGNVTVNHAHIVESEVFVYNLGTMYYVDDILYPEIFGKMVKATNSPTTTVPTTFKLTASPDADIEPVPAVTQSGEQGKDIFVLNERGGNIDESSDFDHDGDDEDDDDEIVTPRALPVQFMIEPPKK